MIFFLIFVFVISVIMNVIFYKGYKVDAKEIRELEKERYILRNEKFTHLANVSSYEEKILALEKYSNFLNEENKKLHSKLNSGILCVPLTQKVPTNEMDLRK